jgi:hypothetical protein
MVRPFRGPVPSLMRSLQLPRTATPAGFVMCTCATARIRPANGTVIWWLDASEFLPARSPTGMNVEFWSLLGRVWT